MMRLKEAEGQSMMSTRIRALLISSPVIVLMTMALALIMVPGGASAGDANLTVHGWVTDSEGTPIEGASVLVENLSRTVPDESGTTDDAGHYQVEFGLSDWEEGDSIRTTATYNAQVESETGIAPASTVLNIDVQFSFAIPEFGSFIGVLVASVLIGALAVFKTRKK